MKSPLSARIAGRLFMPIKKFILFTTILVCSSTALLGQAISGIIIGTVHDASGAVVPKADVTATSIETGVARSTVSGEEGDYVIPNLAPGIYKVTAHFRGFSTSLVPSVSVLVQQTTRVDFALSPGEATQLVTVSAESPLVQSTT